MTQAAANAAEPKIIGRYALFDEIASGGMATVHLGRLLGPVGFGRTVAIKRLHEHYLSDPEFVTMFMDEARIVARIRHPNVVPMVDVVKRESGIFLVMEYVHGESFSRLMRAARAANEPLPVRVVAAIVNGVLLGLHAAHETKGASGELLGVVHRDVSPQNVMIGTDGVARMLDFGIAKAAGRAQVTREGQIKGKLAYMAPEQIRGQVDRRTDVFAAAVVLWEALAGRRLHEGMKEIDIVTRVVRGAFDPPSLHNANVCAALDRVVAKGLSPNPKHRYATARDMAIAIEKAVGLAQPHEVATCIERLAHDALATRSAAVDAMERRAVDLVAVPSDPPPASGDAASSPASEEVHVDAGPSSTPGSDAMMDTPHGTSFSPTHGPSLAESRRAWLVACAVCGALALVGIALGSVAIHRRLTHPVATAEAAREARATPGSMMTPLASPSATLRVRPAAPVASIEASAADGDAASSSASASASAPAAPAANAPATPPPRAFAPRPAPPPPAKKNCDPPYTVDAQNHRHYKPECLATEP